jgi:hypothetical protein
MSGVQQWMDEREETIVSSEFLFSTRPLRIPSAATTPIDADHTSHEPITGADRWWRSTSSVCVRLLPRHSSAHSSPPPPRSDWLAVRFLHSSLPPVRLQCR